jgi:Na+/H+-translocating membrane pyrophosphatase
MSPAGLLFFALFAIIVMGMYLGIRRRWASPVAIAAGGVFLSFLAIFLMALTQNNNVYQALFAGLVVGGLFSGGTLAIAWYFQTNEARKRSAEAAPAEPEATEQP